MKRKKNTSTTKNSSNFRKEDIIYLLFNYKHNYTSSQYKNPNYFCHERENKTQKRRREKR